MSRRRRLTIAAALQLYIADRAAIVAAPERLHQTTRQLVPVLGKYLIDRRLTHRVRTYIESRRQDGVQNPTIRRELVTLRAAIRLAWREGHISAAPPFPLPPNNPGRHRALSRHEIRRLITAARSDDQVRLFIVLAMATGARRGAILELTWDRVNFGMRQIDFRAPHPRAARRKNRAVVPMDIRLRRILHAARGLREANQRVITLDATALRRRLNAVAARAQIAGPITPHLFRHTAATELLRRVPLVIASRMIGHRSVAITEQVYGHLTVGDLAAGARSLARFAGL